MLAEGEETNILCGDWSIKCTPWDDYQSTLPEGYLWNSFLGTRRRMGMQKGTGMGTARETGKCAI